MERLKDHINLHFIGQVKRKHDTSEATSETKNGKENEPSVKKVKVKDEDIHETASPTSPTESITDESGQLKCNSCDIGFSHLSNFVAHKKYYCRGLLQQPPPPAKATSPEVKVGNGQESPSK